MNDITMEEILAIGEDNLVKFQADLSSFREQVGGAYSNLNHSQLKLGANRLLTKTTGLPKRFVEALTDARDLLVRISKDDYTMHRYRLRADELYCEVYNAIYHGMKDVLARR